MTSPLRSPQLLPLLAASALAPLAAAQIGTVDSQQKISDLDGGFAGLLDNVDLFGAAAARLGDLDGDLVPDLAVAASQDDDGGTNRGAVWILFLNADGTVKAEQKISDTDGGFSGVLDDGDQIGVSVAALGDLDGDGIEDLAVGAPQDDDGGTSRGAVWILLLNANGTVKGEQKISDTAGGLAGVLDDGDQFGWSVAAFGDLDGDGTPDLAAGAVGDDDGGSGRGAVWILFLNPNGTVKAEQKISDTTGGFGGVLDNSDQFGSSVSVLPDLDSDGVDDLAAGAWLDDDGGADPGAVWILFLNADGTVKAQQKISALAGGFLGTLDSGDRFGIAVASLGNLDGDGIGDLAVGAELDDDGGTDRGAVWVLFLNADGTVKAHEKISAVFGGFGGVLDNGDRFGSSVAALGDLDSDGDVDLVAGARLDDDGGSDRGAAWVLFLEGFAPPPVADFSGTPTTGVAPLAVAFTDLSSGGTVTSRAWDFGDGGTDTATNPSHTYASAGSYTVSLTATGPGGTDTETKVAYIVVSPPPPVPDFSATPLSGLAPLTVAFTDASSGGPVTSWSWSFGDSGTSTVQNPSHTYTSGSSYTVSLTATGPGGTNTETKTGYVTVTDPPPVADFSAAPLSGEAPLAVAFTDLSSGGPVTSWSWDFGDGATSSAQDPSHTYTIGGTYTVNLTVTGPGGTDSESKFDYIVVSDAPPVADFSGTPTSGFNPLTVAFNDLTSGGPVSSRSWDFGDGGMSTATNPSHTYAAGTYTVSLTVSGPGGSDIETKVGYIVVVEPPPVAEFSGTPTSGTVPLSVSFTDLSSGGPISSWAWDFGDGGTDTIPSPSHSYASPGTYTVSLTVSGPGGTDTETKVGYVVADVPPVADFSGTPLSGVAPVAAAFTDLSTGGAVTSRAWDFGDGGSSTATNPSHTYTAGGAYTVSLTATGPGGTDTETKIDYVIIDDGPPVADFSGTPASGFNPLAVAFSDLSSGGPATSWSWTFGDAGTSTAQNPSHTYTVAGTYTVSLTATGPGGSDGETKVAYITVVEPPPEADFSGSPTSGVYPLAVAFSDATTGPVTGWAWDFGDVGTDTVQNPSHSYAAVGTYTVSLTATGPGGTDTETKVGYIVVNEHPPVADFSGTPTSGIKPLAVSFTDLSSGGPVTSRSWSFGDGGTSTATNPSHTYNSAGTYTVTLAVTGPGGTDSEVKTGYIVVSEPAPIANFSGTPLSGVAPLTVVYSNLTTGGPVTSFLWDFGDGGTSTTTSPVHVYSVAGTYTVSLTATGPGGTDSEVKPAYITVAEGPPVADFSGSPIDGVVPLTTSFLDLSTGTVTSWSWSFGDGGTSSSQNPSHTYTTAGTYNVSLTVVGPTGADTETKNGYVVARPAIAEFVGAPTVGEPPLLVSFTDLSQGVLSSWSWDFGNGATSSAQNIAHIYDVPGKYTVSLTVSGPNGSDTETKVKYISVEKPGVDTASSPSDTVETGEAADFFGRPLVGSAPLTVDFHEMTRGTWVRFNWDFGDGGTSTQKNPTHTYTSPSTYTVSLNVTRSQGAFSATETKVGYIQVTALAGITDGSFEDSGGSPLPSPAWSMSGAGTVVLGPDSSPEDAMPTHGEHWAVVSSAGTSAAVPPANPGGEGALPQGAAGIAQEFLFDAERPLLAFEAAFVLGDQVRSAANDFMSVDVSDGVTSFNLFYADSFGDFSRAARAAPSDTRPMTDVARVTRDLSELFPAADATTRLTLWVQAGNGADGENPSFAWVDDFRLGPVARAQVRSGGNPGCFASSMPVSGAPWRAEVDASALPGALFTVVVGHEAALASDRLQAASGLLVDLDSPQVFFSLLPASGGVDVHELLIPADPALLGRRLFTQAMVIGSASRTYCNAIELVVGF